VQCVARISVTAIADGVGAFGFARPPGLWADSSFVERSRRRRSHKSIASANLTASIGRVAFATFTAWAASLRSTVCATCGHRRLTTHSSGRAARAA